MSFMDPPERLDATKKGPIAAEGPELRTEQNGPIRQNRRPVPTRVRSERWCGRGTHANSWIGCNTW